MKNYTTLPGICLLCLCIAQAFLILPGCDGENSNSCEPELLSGRILGTVSNGSSDSKIDLRIFTADPSDQQSGSHYIKPDSNGAFDLTLPEGRYLLEISFRNSDAHFRAEYYYSQDKVCVKLDQADTLYISAEEETLIDMNFGGLEVIVSVPSELELTRSRLTIFSVADSTMLVARCDATPQNETMHFLLPDLPAGLYLLYCDVIHSSDERSFWLPRTRDPAAAQAFVVLYDTQQTYEISFNETATVSGLIAGSWQAMGCRTPFVRFYTLRDTSLILTCEADENGDYSAMFIAPEPCKAMVSIEGVNNWIGGNTFENCLTITPTPGSQIQNVDHIESGILTEVINTPGSVTQYYSIGIYSTLELTNPVSDVWGLFAETGEITTPNLDPGGYYIQIRNPLHTFNYPWHSQWYPGVESFEDADSLTINQLGETINISFHLQPGGTIEIEGEFQDTDRYLWVSTRIFTSHDSLASGYLPTQADNDTHEFSVLGQGLSNGDYKIAVRTIDRKSPRFSRYGQYIWYPGTTNWEEAEVISIRNHTTVSGLRFEMPIPLPPDE